MALYEGTELLNGQYKDSNFDTYTPLRLGQTPEVKIEFIPSKMPPSGLGEPAVTPVAPAIANAIYQAVGVGKASIRLNLAIVLRMIDTTSQHLYLCTNLVDHISLKIY